MGASETREVKMRRSQVHGVSMDPLLPTGSHVMHRNDPFDLLQEGDLVVFRVPGTLRPVVHRLRERTGNGEWIAQGDNNRFRDAGYVSERNYVGRVEYATTPKGQLLQWEDLKKKGKR